MINSIIKWAVKSRIYHISAATPVFSHGMIAREYSNQFQNYYNVASWCHSKSVFYIWYFSSTKILMSLVRILMTLSCMLLDLNN